MKTTGSSRVVPLVLLTLLVLPLGWRAGAQETRPTPQTIAEIRIVGNEQMSRNAVLASIHAREGQPYDEEVLRDDQRRLLQTGRFRNVRVEKADTPQGVVVVFIVEEQELISAIHFEGNKGIATADLLKELTFAANSPLDPYRINLGLQSIERRYKEKGYFFASVSLDREAMEQRRQVVYRVVEGPRVRVDKIRFEGNKAYGTLRLRLLVKTSTGFWFFWRGRLDTDKVDEDVVSIRNFYHDQGYLDAEVARRLDFSPDKTKVTLVFEIHEGPRYRVNDVQFRGNTVFADAEMLGRLSMAQGGFYTADGARRDVRALQDAYGEIGFIDAEATPHVRYVSPGDPAPQWLLPAEGEAPALVNIVYEIRESEQFRVGRITVRGNDVTQDRVIRRQLRFYPEQLYNTVAVEESRTRLLESRLFDSVTISPYGQEPGVRNALVSVKEANTGEFIVGVGVTTNSGVLGSISLGQRNFSWGDWPDSWSEFIRGQAFKGAGQTMRLTVEPGTELMRARIDWREPYLFDRPISLGAGLYLFTRERESYDESRIGAQASLGKMFKNRWYGELAGRVEDVRIDSLDDDAPPEVIDVKGDNLLAGLKGSLVRDRTDSRWLPSRGDRFAVGYEQVTGDFNFGKADSSYSRYYTAYVDALDRKHILAGRVSAEGIVGGDAPVFEKYYGGGIGDIRGFEYRGISPRSKGTDEPIGGNFKFYAGSEYTYPIYAENLRGVFFLDSGTVEDDYTITTYRVSVGMGIRLLIPYFGPVPMSLDFGFPISKSDEDDTQLLSFSFGWVF